MRIEQVAAAAATASASASASKFRTVPNRVDGRQQRQLTDRRRPERIVSCIFMSPRIIHISFEPLRPDWAAAALTRAQPSRKNINAPDPMRQRGLPVPARNSNSRHGPPRTKCVRPARTLYARQAVLMACLEWNCRVQQLVLV